MNSVITDETVVRLRDDTFSRAVSDADYPMVVDFHGGWVPPWRGLSDDTRAGLASRFAGRVQLAEVNTVEERKTAELYGVEQIPNVFVLVRGKVVRQFVGTVETATISQVLDEILKRFE